MVNISKAFDNLCHTGYNMTDISKAFGNLCQAGRLLPYDILSNYVQGSVLVPALFFRIINDIFSATFNLFHCYTDQNTLTLMFNCLNRPPVLS